MNPAAVIQGGLVLDPISLRSTTPSRLWALRRAACWLCLALLPACGASKPSAARSGHLQAAGITQANLQHLPQLVLVTRAGDAVASAALAVQHPLGFEASWALAHRTLGLLEQAGFNPQSNVSALGFVLFTSVGSEQVDAFVQTVMQALREPASSGLRPRDERHSAISVDPAADDAFAVPHCLGAPAARGARAAVSANQLRTWQQRLSPNAVALAFVGDAQITQDARSAHAGLDPWHDAGAPSPLEWPEQDELQQTRASARGAALGAQLDFAIRYPRAASAFAVAAALERPDSDLALRLGNYGGQWQVSSAEAVSWPFGGCLQAQLRAKGPVAPDEAAQVLLDIRDDSPEFEGGWLMSRSVLAPTEAHEVARRAAWHILNRDVEHAAPRVTARLTRSPNAAPGKFQLTRWGNRLRVHPASLQGREQLWAFISSACGTRLERTRQAGRLGLALHTVAQRFNGELGVELSAVVSPEVSGIMARTTRQMPSETRDQQAKRLARALGRALSSPLDERDSAGVREALLAGLGEQDRGLELALERAAPGRVSWLAPLGTWSSLLSQPSQALDEARRQFATQATDLSLLLNGPEQGARQREIFGATLEDFMRPFGGPRRLCRNKPPAPEPGHLKLTTEARYPKAFVLAPVAEDNFAAAHWTTLLLNRRWLPQALRAPGLVGDARARLLGSNRYGAIVVELAVVDDQLQPAIAQTQALLARLADGAVTAADLALAEASELEAQNPKRDAPERQLLALAGVPAPEAPSLEALRVFCAEAFVPTALVVVEVQPRLAASQ